MQSPRNGMVEGTLGIVPDDAPNVAVPQRRAYRRRSTRPSHAAPAAAVAIAAKSPCSSNVEMKRSFLREPIISIGKSQDVCKMASSNMAAQVSIRQTRARRNGRLVQSWYLAGTACLLLL